MGSEYDVLYAIALKKGWWVPLLLEDYPKQDCINYWNEMIKWEGERKMYYRRRDLRQAKGSDEPLNHPKRPRKPIRRSK